MFENVLTNIAQRHYPLHSPESIVGDLREITAALIRVQDSKDKVEEYERRIETFTMGIMWPPPSLLWERVCLEFQAVAQSKIHAHFIAEAAKCVIDLFEKLHSPREEYPPLEEFPFYVALTLMRPFDSRALPLSKSAAAIDRLNEAYVKLIDYDGGECEPMRELYRGPAMRAYERTKIAAFAACVTFLDCRTESDLFEAQARIGVFEAAVEEVYAAGRESFRPKRIYSPSTAEHNAQMMENLRRTLAREPLA